MALLPCHPLVVSSSLRRDSAAPAYVEWSDPYGVDQDRVAASGYAGGGRTRGAYRARLVSLDGGKDTDIAPLFRLAVDRTDPVQIERR